MHDIALYEIVILPQATANTALALDSELYNIESNNTNELRSQSAATDTGNEHTIAKTSDEALIATKIPSGELALVGISTTTEEQEVHVLARVLFF